MNTLNNRFSKCGASLKILPLAIALACGVAHAEDVSSMFSYSGFGTVGAAHSSSTDGDYVTSYNSTAGAGRTNSWAFGVDTELGGQVNVKFSDKFFGVVQVIARDQTNNTFSPRVEWANLGYKITPDLQVRVGRIALPLFMVSDTRLVGYSNTWLRAPIETYNSFSITNSDGVDLSYKSHFGSVNNTVQVYDGKTSNDLYLGNGTVSRGFTAKQMKGIQDTVEYGAFTARAGLMKANLELPLGPYVIPSASEVINFGLSYDPGTWFVQGEITKVKLPNIVSDEKAIYVTGGYRIKSFTPFASYSQARPDGGGNGAGPGDDMSTTSVGVRWDVMKNVDVKMQLDRISLGSKSRGYFTNATPALAGSSINLFGVVVDFVF